MAFYLAVFALFSTLCGAAKIQVHRRAVHDDTSGVNPVLEKKNLYWFGNFTVGDSSGLELLIDTGSSNLLLNPGLYKPSNKSVKSSHPHFSISYEGVNKKGTGFETINGTVYLDTVTSGNLTCPQYAIGDIKKYKVIDAPPKKHAVSGDGIVGMGLADSSAFKPQTGSWFEALCNKSVISDCRMGLVFGTNKKGVQVIGEYDKSLAKGDLYVSSSTNALIPGYVSQADITLNNKVFLKNQTIILDSGTSNIQAPIHAAKKIYDALGYKYVKSVGGPSPFNSSENIIFLTAFFPCDKPPTVGLKYPAEVTLKKPQPGTSKKSKNFNILSSEWVLKDYGNNNCSSILAGTNALDNIAWLIGQPFIQGHYVDFNLAGSGFLGFADVPDPSNIPGSG